MKKEEEEKKNEYVSHTQTHTRKKRAIYLHSIHNNNIWQPIDRATGDIRGHELNHFSGVNMLRLILCESLLVTAARYVTVFFLSDVYCLYRWMGGTDPFFFGIPNLCVEAGVFVYTNTRKSRRILVILVIFGFSFRCVWMYIIYQGHLICTMKLTTPIHSNSYGSLDKIIRKVFRYWKSPIWERHYLATAFVLCQFNNIYLDSGRQRKLNKNLFYIIGD